MPFEIWNYVFKFLDSKDIYLLKFICKRFNQIAFLNKDIEYYSKISHEIFDLNNYYDYFNIQLQNLFEKVKKNYTDTANLILKFSLDELKKLFFNFECFISYV